ncbi:3-deoxy-D-manno-octulosonic acid kinase [Saccharophagus sp. K07]|uniref:3-deoxy-D-manno-octulosonic acid kinase n=1 Tax=Saccharophagus sp. K07 TaxID=2283636 RepID=UPI00165289C4|nr:3-deoxy-D-manno-octulosonic acid kinase [Saccharophagus sp. K07]MBC6905983.1 3-deoxy-D-manno-octulosonic acid kinase [Saccharophagus sp. K07]
MAEQSPTQTEQDSTIYFWNLQALPQAIPEIFTPTADNHNTLGRGTVILFRHGDMDLVLRHYQRGGFVRHFIRDLYFGSEVQNTRMWREFRLLLRLRELDLPVPTPIAARCCKTGPFLYRGDLITQLIPASKTLAQTLQNHPLSDAQWSDLGKLLACFHQHGVYHADLNANNILLNEQGQFFLLDFDRGEIREPAATWQQNNLDRLLRSLRKLQARHSPFHWHDNSWQLVLNAYRQASQKL